MYVTLGMKCMGKFYSPSVYSLFEFECMSSIHNLMYLWVETISTYIFFLDV